MLREAGAEREVRRSAVIDCRGLQPQMHVKSQLRCRRKEQGFDGTLRRRRKARREEQRRCEEWRIESVGKQNVESWEGTIDISPPARELLVEGATTEP